MTSSDKAIRKASSKRLLADFARAARLVSWLQNQSYQSATFRAPEWTLLEAGNTTSRTRYACLMTAFGK